MLTENRTKVLIAIIGLIGILGGAFFANWDKIFPSPSPSPESPPVHPDNGKNKHDIPREPPPNEVHDEITRRLEELQMELENNDREQMKVHEDMERLRPFFETDRDAQQGIEDQRMHLERLEMVRSRVQREIDHLREQR